MPNATGVLEIRIKVQECVEISLEPKNVEEKVWKCLDWNEEAELQDFVWR